MIHRIKFYGTSKGSYKILFVSLRGKLLIHMDNEDYSSEEYLFDEKTLKSMNQDVETIHDKSRNRNF